MPFQRDHCQQRWTTAVHPTPLPQVACWRPRLPVPSQVLLLTPHWASVSLRQEESAGSAPGPVRMEPLAWKGWAEAWWAAPSPPAALDPQRPSLSSRLPVLLPSSVWALSPPAICPDSSRPPTGRPLSPTMLKTAQKESRGRGGKQRCFWVNARGLGTPVPSPDPTTVPDILARAHHRAPTHTRSHAWRRVWSEAGRGERQGGRGRRGLSPQAGAQQRPASKASGEAGGLLRQDCS